MDLFVEKLKQNRLYKKNRGRRVLVCASVQRPDDALDRISDYTNAIVVLRIFGLRADFCDYWSGQGFQCVYLDGRDPLPRLTRLLEGEPERHSEQERFPPESPTAPLWGFLLELHAGAEAFLVNDLLIQAVPGSFALSGTVTDSKGICYPLYRNGADINRPPTGSGPTAVITDWFFGYGDAIMSVPVIQAFLGSRRRGAADVHLITRAKTARFFRDRLPGIAVVQMMDSFHMYEAVVKSGIYRDVFFLSLRLTDPEAMHVTELWAKALGMDGPPDNCSAFRGFLGRPEDALASRLSALKRRYPAVIGLQHHTGERERCWPAEHADEFARLCRQAGIGVLQLAPAPRRIGHAHDLSDLPLDSLLPLVPMLDAVVGIDSVFGHAAGLAGIPNITLWGKNYPHMQKTSPTAFSFLSFRTLTMNYSLVPTTAACKDIEPGLVFRRLRHILDGTIPLQRTTITIRDTISGRNVEWVSA